MQALVIVMEIVVSGRGQIGVCVGGGGGGMPPSTFSPLPRPLPNTPLVVQMVSVHEKFLLVCW